MPSTHLLVVQDDSVTAIAMVEAFEGAGYEVSLCGTAFDAINIIEMEPDIAAIVTDLCLADGSSGWEVAAAAHERLPHIPVIYMSDGPLQESRSHGVRGSLLLPKPIAPEYLVAAITELLR